MVTQLLVRLGLSVGTFVAVLLLAGSLASAHSYTYVSPYGGLVHLGTPVNPNLLRPVILAPRPLSIGPVYMGPAARPPQNLTPVYRRPS
jgi:hypothetical protein